MIIENGKRLPTITEHGIYGFFGEFRYLSNFHFIKIEIDGIVYPSTEHAYTAYKTQDRNLKKIIAAFPHPRDARAMGQEILLRPDWEQYKVAAMLDCLQRKFANEELSSCLLKTGSLYLEETNNWGDKFWGYCEGGGLNMLGKNLMLVRSFLKSGHKNFVKL